MHYGNVTGLPIEAAKFFFRNKNFKKVKFNANRLKVYGGSL